MNDLSKANEILEEALSIFGGKSNLELYAKARDFSVKNLGDEIFEYYIRFYISEGDIVSLSKKRDDLEFRAGEYRINCSQKRDNTKDIFFSNTFAFSKYGIVKSFEEITGINLHVVHK